MTTEKSEKTEDEGVVPLHVEISKDIYDRMVEVREKTHIPLNEQAEKALRTWLVEMDDAFKKMGELHKKLEG